MRRGSCRDTLISELLIALCLLLLLATSGCYAGLAGAVLGILSLSKDNQSGGVVEVIANRPPAAPTIREAIRVDGAHVLITYILLDDDGGPLNVRFEYQPVDDGGEALLPFAPATDAVQVKLLDGTLLQSDRDLRVEPNISRVFRYLWDARPDLLRPPFSKPAGCVRVRFTALEEGEESQPGLSEPFIAGNAPPQALSVVAAAASGVVPITVSLADSTSDPVTLQAAYLIGEERHLLTLVGAGPGTTFETSADGREVPIFWDSRADLGATAAQVRIEIQPSDLERGTGSSVDLTVDNNSDPLVQLVELAGSPDRSFEVPIRFILRDEDEEDSIRVILQWAPLDQPFRDLPVPQNPSLEDLDFLDKLLTSAEGQFVEGRRALRILSEAPRFIRGTVSDSSDLPLDQLRVTSFANHGLLFRPPSQSGPRPLGDLPWSDGSGVFVVGKEIRIVGGQKDPAVVRKIVGFDPRSSALLLDGECPRGLQTRYELKLAGGLVRLSSSNEGLLHTFVWDSFRDLIEARADFSTRVKVRALAVDSQLGAFSPEIILSLDDSFLTRAPSLVTGDGPTSVATGDLNGDGRDDVAVAHKLSDPSLVFLQNPEGSLSSSGSLEVSTVRTTSSASVAMGDLNADGLADLVVTDNSKRARLFLQRPGGLPLAADQELPLESGPYAVAIGDVDADGRNDLVVAAKTAAWLEIFHQSKDSPAGGSNPLPATPSLIKTEFPPIAVALGDVNGDEKTDLVVSMVHPAPSTTVFFQTGGELIPSGSLPDEVAGLSSDAGGVGIADLNGDRWNDVVVLNVLNTNPPVKVNLHLQEATDHTLSACQPQTSSCSLRVSGELPTSVAIGDLNGDRRNDLVVVNSGRNAGSDIFLQGAGGAFPEEPTESMASEVPLSASLGDLNGDRRQDLVVVNSGADTADVFLQKAPGTLPPSPILELSVLNVPFAVSIGDLNADGRQDVAVSGGIAGSVTVLLQGASGTFASHRLPRPAEAIAIADLSGDGRNDLALVDPETAAAIVYLQSPTGVLTPGAAIGGGAEIRETIAIGDFSGDGRNDLVVARFTAKTADVFLQEPDGTLSSSPSGALDLGFQPGEVVAGDLNGDGRDDLAVLNRGEQKIVFYLQTSTRPGVLAAEPSQAAATGRSPQAIDIGDLNADGRSDLAVVNAADNTVGIYLQDSSGSLGAPAQGSSYLPNHTLSTQRGSVATGIADVDGDGLEDVLVTSEEGGTVGIYLQGSGSAPGLKPAGGMTSLPNQILSTGLRPRAFAVSDLNGDGWNDLVVANSKGNTPNQYPLSVFLAR